MVAGRTVLGLEGAVAWGTNSIEDGPSSTTNFVRLWSLAARLGVTF